MRLAYFSPLNPVQTGISDYSEELLPLLAPYGQIDLFVDGYRPSNPDLAGFAVRDGRSFTRRAGRYDAILYHMGNSPAHAYIYEALRRVPGVVVLHELVLHHLISWLSWDRGDARTYLHEFRFCYGAEGEALARRIILGQAHVNFFDYPLSDRVIKAARGLIVHSDYVRQGVLKVRPDAPVRVAPMGIPLPEASAERRAVARQRLGIAPSRLVLGSFGHINPFKRIDAALRAFRVLRQTYPDALYVLVGSISPNYDVRGLLRMLGLGDSVRQIGYSDSETFYDYMAAMDICLNLRYPTAGETSASVLRLMGAGLPVLVSRTGAFQDLPDDACVKIDLDETEREMIIEFLRLLAGKEELRQRIGANARRYVAERHSLACAAGGYLDALRAWYPGIVPEQPFYPAPQLAAVKRALPKTGAPAAGQTSTGAAQAGAAEPALASVAQAAAELGMDDQNPTLGRAARAWVELGLARRK